jgi:hypothetical protein
MSGGALFNSVYSTSCSVLLLDPELGSVGTRTASSKFFRKTDNVPGSQGQSRQHRLDNKTQNKITGTNTKNNEGYRPSRKQFQSQHHFLQEPIAGKTQVETEHFLTDRTTVTQTPG